MKIRMSLLALIFFSSLCHASSFWQPSGPYLEFGAGGTTYQQQNSYSRTLNTVSSGGTTSTFTDDVYSKAQQNNSLDLLLNAAAGFHVNPYLRLALAYSYFKYPALSTRNYGLYNNSTTYAPASTQLYTLNLYVDFAAIFGTKKFNPYLGLGIGTAINQLEQQNSYTDAEEGQSLQSITHSSSQNNFAYKFMAGINYLLMPHLWLTLQYAFVNAGQYVTGNRGYTLTGPILFAPAGATTYVYTQPGKFAIYANQFTGGLSYDFS